MNRRQIPSDADGPIDPDAPPSVRIERDIDAGRERVWQMWTVADHFSQWYGPTGARIPIAEMDVRVGGRRFVAMEMGTPDGVMRMWFVGEFVEVDPPGRLVYSEAPADEHGNALPPERSGMPDGHPSATQVVVELTEVAGGTRMVLTHRGVPADSPGATGWTMALDKLEAHLAP